MSQEAPVVHCVYTENDTPLDRLIEESFRLYLSRVLGLPGPDTP